MEMEENRLYFTISNITAYNMNHCTP